LIQPWTIAGLKLKNAGRVPAPPARPSGMCAYETPAWSHKLGSFFMTRRLETRKESHPSRIHAQILTLSQNDSKLNPF
jgi:hypothetical protein